MDKICVIANVRVQKKKTLYKQQLIFWIIWSKTDQNVQEKLKTENTVQQIKKKKKIKKHKQ